MKRLALIVFIICFSLYTFGQEKTFIRTDYQVIDTIYPSNWQAVANDSVVRTITNLPTSLFVRLRLTTKVSGDTIRVYQKQVHADVYQSVMMVRKQPIKVYIPTIVKSADAQLVDQIIQADSQADFDSIMTALLPEPVVIDTVDTDTISIELMRENLLDEFNEVTDMFTLKITKCRLSYPDNTELETIVTDILTMKSQTVYAINNFPIEDLKTFTIKQSDIDYFLNKLKPFEL